MRSTPTAHAGLHVTIDPIVVMVASDDPELARRVRSIAVFAGHARVIDVRSTRQAIEIAEALYESPTGCPDVLLLDRESQGAEQVRRLVRGRCPGVRVFGFGPDTPDARLERTVRQAVRQVLEAAT